MGAADSHNWSTTDSHDSIDVGSGSMVGGSISITKAVPVRCAAPAPAPNVHVANATCNIVHLFYKGEKMAVCHLIQGIALNALHGEAAGSILIQPGDYIECPIFEDLYVTGFNVSAHQPFCCPDQCPLFDNFLAENAQGVHKSCIITACGGVKFAKTGEIWVDEAGEDHAPQQ